MKIVIKIFGSHYGPKYIQAINDAFGSGHAKCGPHKTAISSELLSRASPFHIEEESLVKEANQITVMTLIAAFWFAKEEMAMTVGINQKTGPT